VLFHVVNDGHLLKRPMIFTTHKPLSEWGKVLHDEDLATAILEYPRARTPHPPRWTIGTNPSLKLEAALPANADRANLVFSILILGFALTPFIQDRSLMR
jgi:hypothetical protein